MLKHSLLLIYRNYVRAKGYFFINLIGLATGLTCTLLIYLWVRDELNMNKFHEHDARLYQVMEHQQYADNLMTTSSTPGILSEGLKDEFPEVEFAATLTWVNPFTLSVGEHNVKAKGFYVGADFFQIFSFPLIEGQADKVLTDKLSIVISRDMAMKLFDTDQNLIGKVVEFQHQKSFTVTGVYENLPSSSSYQFDFVLPFEVFKEENQWVTEWGNNGPSTMIVLREGSDAGAFSDKIKDYIKGKNEESNVTLFIQKFSDRYLYGRYENGVQSGGRIEYVNLFSIIAIVILIIACINFMNLATARASRKAKEVGIKKSIGAQRRSLVFQYISESMVLTVLAVLLSLALVWLILPQFNSITEKNISLLLNDPQLMMWLFAITVFTGIVAGSYPALYLSGFKPAAVLKGVVKGSWGELWARKGLVVFQFSISVFLIVSVLVVYKQVSFVQSKNLGYTKEQLIQFPIEGKVLDNRKTFLEQVRNIPGVVNASAIGHSLLGRNSNTGGLQWEGKNPEDIILFENIRVDYNLFETLELEFLEGRPFSEEYGADSSKIIFNEAAIKVMGLDEPIGKTVKLWQQYDMEIIGVVKDFHFQSLHDVVNPAFFALTPQYTWNIMIRLEAGKEKETLEALRNFYADFNPGFTFDYQFQDQEYARMYAAEQRVASLSFYFASMAIVISCLGLFGLAAFTAERRQKEIGIRKALGSSSTNIVLLLSGDFTRMVLISILIGLPLSYWLLDQWLERFAFHISLEAWYFVAAGFLALLIAWLTVASQAIKAANVNPVKCLRTE
ncbi:MAG: ABC transporter permease [Cyclobacteriaceae bacterium]|nr:MAG: ABC transporter permease [Cyclobacteriaceae bacterium]